MLAVELAARPGLDPSRAAVAAAVEAFRAERGLGDEAELREWLATTGQDYDGFVAGLVRELRLERLRRTVADDLLEGYFEDRRAFLDRVLLGRVVAGSMAEAAGLSRRPAGELRFERLSPVRVLDLPRAVRLAVDGAAQGAVLGPFELSAGPSLLRLEEVLPARLDDPATRDALRSELFESWLAERMEALRVELTVPA